jgi:hypothetical protein
MIAAQYKIIPIGGPSGEFRKSTLSPLYFSNRATITPKNPLKTINDTSL